MSRVARSRAALDGDVALVYESGDADPGACERLLDGHDAVLVVAVGRRPREWLAGRDPAVDPAFVATYPHPDCERVVSDPGDLPALAVAAGDALDALPPAAAPAVCVDDLATLLEHANSRRVGRFLQVLAGRARAAGGTLHCHADGDAVASLPAADVLFDGVVRPDA